LKYKTKVGSMSYFQCWDIYVDSMLIYLN